MMEISAFIFDVDGVLTDTVEPHYQSWVRLGAEEGIALAPDFKDQMRGLTRPMSLRLFLDGREVSEEVAEDYLRRKNDYFLESLDQLTERDLLPGVRALLEDLAQQNLPIAIGSASKNAREVVRRAHAAGMRVIGVGPRDRVGGADLVVDTLAGLTLGRIRAALNN